MGQSVLFHAIKNNYVNIQKFKISRNLKSTAKTVLQPYAFLVLYLTILNLLNLMKIFVCNTPTYTVYVPLSLKLVVLKKN